MSDEKQETPQPNIFFSAPVIVAFIGFVGIVAVAIIGCISVIAVPFIQDSLEQKRIRQETQEVETANAETATAIALQFTATYTNAPSRTPSIIPTNTSNIAPPTPRPSNTPTPTSPLPLSIMIVRQGNTVGICPNQTLQLNEIELILEGNFSYELSTVFPNVSTIQVGECVCLQPNMPNSPLPTICTSNNTSTQEPTGEEWRNASLFLIIDGQISPTCEPDNDTQNEYECPITIER